MILRLAAEHYADRLSCLGQSKETVKNVKFHLSKFVVWIMDNFAVEESKFLRRFHLQAFQRALSIDHSFSPTYINQRIIAVNALLKWLSEETEVSKNLEKILQCIKEPKKLPQVISVDDYDLILKSNPCTNKVDFRNHTIMVLLMSSGIRVGALVRLTVKDVNLEELTLKVTGKGDKERIAVFGEKCKDVLSEYLKAIRPLFKSSKSSESLFLNMNNKPVTIRSCQKIIKKMAENAGISERVTPHTLRRTFCTELIKADGNLYHIAQMMGHESLEHLKSYARLNIKPLKETHKKCHPRG